MGLFFGKKKNESKVPVPVRNVSEEKVLSFSKRPEPEQVIHPEELKAAAGLSQEFRKMEDPTHPLNTAPEPMRAAPRPMMSEMSSGPEPMPLAMPAPGVAPTQVPTGPVHLHVRSYQKILGELEGMKREVGHLSNVNKSLEKSEYNEEKDFAKLKITVKNIHDKLLSADKILFKS